MSKFKFISIFITLAILYTINVRAADIVRLQFDYADPAEYTPDPDSTWEVPLPPLPRTNYTYFLDLELFTDSAPDTVANYLDYVTSGSYDGTFIYRSLTDFVMQTGGYTFRPNDPVNNPLRTIEEATGLELVPVGPLSPVLNEFNRSNLRGTIAMAKLDNQPDSASNEWFINLADNSANLDSQNGGFTVFGGVIDDGMAIITDEISTFYIHNFISVLLGSAFNNMPVTSAIYGAIYQSDMIMITSATVINRPIVRFAPAVGDYDLDIAGDSIVELLTTTVKNTGNENAVIGTVNSADLAAPFSLVTDNCSDAILQPQSILSTSVCTIVFSFSAATEGAFNDDINIPYTSQISGDTFSVAYPLKGVGVPGTPVISSDTINLNTFETMANTSTDETVTIRNEGGSTLNIINIGISGVDAADFSILSGCSTGTNLAMEESCTVSIRFSPTTAGTKTGALNVDSNAGSLTVDLAGLSTQPVISVQSSIDIVAQLNQTASNYALVTNTGTGDLTLFTMDISGTDAAFFTQINNCPDTNNSGGATAPLGASQQCVILIEYTPTVAGSHSALVTITSNDPDTPTTTITLTGSVDEPIISVPGNLSLGTAQVGDTVSKNLIITNNGLAPLEVTAISGIPANGFTQSNNCIVYLVAANSTCTVTITYSAATIGSANVTLSISSSDPVNPTITVNIDAYGDKDTDGIASTIENDAPNSGDSNNDGIADDIQNNVASFITSNTEYMTLVSDNSVALKAATVLRNITIETSDAITVLDKTVTFDYDLHGFTIDLPIGDAVYVAIYLPVDANPGGYYKFGPTPDNTTPHWYEFNYDPITETGATLVGKVTIDPYGPNPFDRYMIVLSFIDGARGDDDLTSNGQILQNKGGVDFNKVVASSDSGSGSTSILAIIFTTLLMLHLRRKSYRDAL